jgi:glucose-6-phosphate 1-dehydrogenase
MFEGTVAGAGYQRADSLFLEKFTTAEGIERLWEVSMPLLDAPPPVQLYPPGAWGPKSVHQLVAPHAWRLPFERAWRNPNPVGS